MASSKPFVEGGVIDGKAVAAAIREKIAVTVRLLKEKHGKVCGNTTATAAAPASLREHSSTPTPGHPPFHHTQVPGLAVVIVGERKDSQTYVRMKRKACEEVGIASFGADLPDTATQQEVLDVVQQLNANPDVHGILVQLPVREQEWHVCWGSIAATTGPARELKAHSMSAQRSQGRSLDGCLLNRSLQPPAAHRHPVPAVLPCLCLCLPACPPAPVHSCRDT